MRSMFIIILGLLVAGAARAADVTIDLGDAGTLTVSDVTTNGVSVITVMKAAVDDISPPGVDGNGDPIVRTNVEYRDELISILSEKGRATYARKLVEKWAEAYEAANPVPNVLDFLTLTPAP